MSDLLERLSSEVILADGAMGTMLHSRGVSFEKCFDELNLTNPVAVADVHREYIEAGAQLILTNTFGANRFKLGKARLGEQNGRDQQSRCGTCQAYRCRLLSKMSSLLAMSVRSVCALRRLEGSSRSRHAPRSRNKLKLCVKPART